MKSEIVPFALANSGYGWLVRAFDRQGQEFCDVALARISDARLATSVVLEHECLENDIQWQRIVELELVPHPINVHEDISVESDFGMKGGRLMVNVRASQVCSFLRRWDVDCSEKHSLKGKEYRLWLSNRQAIYGVANLSIAPGYDRK